MFLEVFREKYLLAITLFDIFKKNQTMVKKLNGSAYQKLRLEKEERKDKIV